MGYRRVTVSDGILLGDELTRAMSGIGMRFASKPLKNANIEDTIIAASFEGMENDDLRVLSILVAWIQIHHPWINVDRMTRAVDKEKMERVRAFWSSMATWLQKDRRFARMAGGYDGPQVELPRIGADFHIQRKGEDPRFKNTCLKVPAGILRERKSDVLSPSQLAKIHQTYRKRVLMGPTYRADMWAALEIDPTLSSSELARRTYGSFATAWQVKKDFEILAA